MSCSSWVLLILLVLIVGGSIYFATMNTEQPVRTITMPVSETNSTADDQ